MLRSVWTVMVAIVISIVCASTVLLIAMVSSASPLIEPVIRFWARTILRAAGIEATAADLDRIDPARRYVLIANHYSYFDIPCIFAAIPHRIRFMAKVSLFKIPVFGWALARAGFIPIDRKNRRTAVKSFDLAGKRIRRGNTIVVFPEEGRTATRELRPFQRGAFLLAMKSELPVVPIAIDGTHEAFPVGARRIRPGRVVVRVGIPIPTEGRSVREKERLADEAKAQIEGMLGMGPMGPMGLRD